MICSIVTYECYFIHNVCYRYLFRAIHEWDNYEGTLFGNKVE